MGHRHHPHDLIGHRAAMGQRHPDAQSARDVDHLRGGAGGRGQTRCAGPDDLGLTLYPEDLMWTPLLVSVDFILMKKDRSRVLSGARRLGLLDSTATHRHTQTHRDG